MRRDTNPDVKQVGFSLRNTSQRKFIKKLKVVTRLLENRIRGRAFVASLCKRKKREAATKLVYLLSRGIFAFRLVVSGDSGTLAES